jgi:hypothetical protein
MENERRIIAQWVKSHTPLPMRKELDFQNNSKEIKRMSIYVYKNNQQVGPFEETAVLLWLNSGQLSGEDLACRTGANNWQPLKTLFADPPQVSTTSVSAAAGSGQEFYNQQVVNWARRNFQTPVEIKLRYNSLPSRIFVGIAIAIGAVCAFWLPVAILVRAIYILATEGWSRSVSSPLIFGFVLLLVFGGLFFGLVYWLGAARRKIAEVFDTEGVRTRGGKKHLWENLSYLNYKKVSTRVHGNLVASLVQSAVYAGAEKTTVELVFANGKSLIPPLIVNQSEILVLLGSIPCNAVMREQSKSNRTKNALV